MEQALLGRFYTLMEQDSIVLEYASSHDLLIIFKLVDYAQDIFFWFKGGHVQVGEGQPDGGKVEVQISLKSDQFDAMLTGKLNPYFAAMNGKIRVDGDILKATELLKLHKDMVRIYSAAKSNLPV